jgi:pimeloyl-ACP methyl ester carboxylesterase
MYPFDSQIDALSSRYRILIPDRTGYGQSGRVKSFPPGFHENAANEMRWFLDKLQIDRCVLWGHSDGAVSAVRMGIADPDRFPAIILEAIHIDRCKPSSREFFLTAATNPQQFGSTIASAMSSQHGSDYWQELMMIHGRAWLDILDNCRDPSHDLYSGRLGELSCPSLLIHGSEDPRTEPNELIRLQAVLPALTVHIIERARHSPHSEPTSAFEATQTAQEFLDRHVV